MIGPERPRPPAWVEQGPGCRSHRLRPPHALCPGGPCRGSRRGRRDWRHGRV